MKVRKQDNLAPFYHKAIVTVLVFLFILNVKASIIPHQHGAVSEMATYNSRNDIKPGIETAAALTDPYRPSFAEAKRYLASKTIISPPKVDAVYEDAPCPTTCQCTKDTATNRYYINCKYKNLFEIPTFKQTNIIYYELTFSMNNYIKQIPYWAFRNLQVEKIDLLNNDIEKVEDGAFFGLQSILRILYLQGNGEIPIPYSKISNLLNLTELKLHKFREEKIPANNILRSFEKLEKLELHDIKNLVTIDTQAFAGKLQNLFHLDFDMVNFEQIPVASLEHLKGLTKLGIRNSKIKAIYSNSFAHENFRGLKEIDFSYNNIQLIEADAFQTVSENLAVLDLTYNSLQTSSLAGLENKLWRKLYSLNLSYNSGIGRMSGNIFKNMPNLQYLNLIGVNLLSISSNLLSGLNNLHSLELSYNNIQDIQNGAFLKTPKLKDLRLGDQQHIDNLNLSPAKFSGIADSILHLSLANTPLKPDQFWDTIKVFTELQNLYITKTSLNEIPDFAFQHNTKLQVIELAENGISYLSHAAFSGLEHTLNKINLQSNNLTTVTQCVFKDFSKLENIFLYGNKLHCDCELIWLHNFITRRAEEQIDFLKEEFQCETPKAVPLYTIPVENLACHDSTPKGCDSITEMPITTSASTTTASFDKTSVSSKPASTKTPNSLKLSIAGKTKTSITLSWGVIDRTQINQFKLNFSSTSDDTVTTIKLHPNTFFYTISGLEPGKLYEMCVTAEIGLNDISTVKDCITRETSYSDTQFEDNQNSDTDASSRNILIAGLLITVFFVILVIAGLYMVVKYKIQKLKQIRLAMTSPGLGRQEWDYCGREESSTSTVPNEYTEISKAKRDEKYKIYYLKQMQKLQDTGDEYHQRAYSTYHKIKSKKRGKNEDYKTQDSKEEVNQTEENEHQKSDLELRHSAPSRLDANDLLKAGIDRNSRPLPATPKQQQIAPHDEIKEKVKDKQVFMTQASVYENRISDTPTTLAENKPETIYYEITASNTSLPKN